MADPIPGGFPADAAPTGTFAGSAASLERTTDHATRQGEEAPTTEVAGTDYEILAELGRGGMGVVYKARQIKLGRIVALKMALGAADLATEDLARFRTEAEAVARLQHPNIVTVYEVGERGGRPFFSQELVDGGTLAHQLARAPLPPIRAAALVETLARAMHVAHQAGVVHRDLKPANVLFTRDGAPKVADFGLAKKLDEDAGQTRTGAILGTPSYMAPEQAEGRTSVVGPAADIYALGAVLYECLTGRPPFKAASLLETLELVRSRDAVPPSRLQPKVPRDLETICLKCLRKELNRRYVSAHALAEDLRRFLDGRPIAARPVGRAEAMAKWARRRPGLTALLAVTVSTVLAALGVITAFYFAEKDARQGETVAKIDAQKKQGEARDAAEKERIAANKERTATAKATAALDQEQRANYSLAIGNALREYMADNVAEADRLLDECRWDLRGSEWNYLRRICHAEVARLVGHAGFVHSVAFSPDGKFLLSGGSAGLGPGGDVALWDLTTGKRVAGGDARMDAVLNVAFSRDGKRVTILFDQPRPARGMNDPEVRAAMLKWTKEHLGGNVFDADPETRRLLLPLFVNKTIKVFELGDGKDFRGVAEVSSLIRGAAFSPDGRHVGTASQKGMELWDITANKVVKGLVLPGHVDAPAFSADGKLLAGVLTKEAGGPPEIVVWDLDDTKGATGIRGLTGPATALAFRPDGGMLAAACKDGALRLWGLSDGKVTGLRTLGGNGKAALCLAFSPDGTRLAAGGEDRTVKVFSLVGADLNTVVYRGHQFAVEGLAFSPDGKRLASVGPDKVVRLWDATTSPEGRSVVAHGQEAMHLAVSADGRRIATSNAVLVDGRLAPGEVRTWDADTLALLRTWELPVAPFAFSPQPAFAPGDGALVLLSRHNHVQFLDPSSGATLRSVACKRVGHDYPWVSFSPDGRYLAIDSELREARTGKSLLHLPDLLPGKSQITCHAFSPDSQRLAVSDNNYVGLLELPSGKLLWTSEASMQGFLTVSFSAGGRIAGVSGLGELKVWSTETGKETTRFPVPVVGSQPRCAAFVPGQERLASGHQDGTVKYWDATTGQLVSSGQAHNGAVHALAFLPDGRLATCGQDRKLKTWNLRPLDEPRTIRTEGAPDVHARQLFLSTLGMSLTCRVQYTHDGRHLIAADGYKPASVYDLRTGRLLERLSLPAGQVEALALSGDGTRLAVAVQKRKFDFKRSPRPGVVQVDLTPGATPWADMPSEGQVIKVFAIPSYAEVTSLEAPGARRASVAFAPDGRRLAVAAGRDVKIWNFDDSNWMLSLSGHTRDVTAVAFSPDGEALASGAAEVPDKPEAPAEIFLWHLAKGERTRTLPGLAGPVVRVSFSPDGKSVAAATGSVRGLQVGKAMLWKVETGRQVRTMANAGSSPMALAFRPDGKALAVANEDASVDIWDLLSNRKQVLRGHLVSVKDVMYRSDGLQLATAGSQEIKVWEQGAGLPPDHPPKD